MSPAEIATLIVEIGNRVDLQWGLFVTVHLAILGAVVYIDRPLRRPEKLAALVIYTGFAFVNYQQMSNQLKLLDAAYVDIHEIALTQQNHPEGIVQRLAHEYSQGRHKWAVGIVIGSHALMYVLVFLSVVFDQALVKKNA